MLKLVGMIRNGNETRELFEVDGKLIAFNVEQSSFDVICGNTNLLGFASESLERATCVELCNFLDDGLDFGDPQTAVIIPAQEPDSKQGLLCVLIDEEGGHLRRVTQNPLVAKSMGNVHMPAIDEIIKFFKEGTMDSIEDDVLIREYQHTYMTV